MKLYDLACILLPSDLKPPLSHGEIMEGGGGRERRATGRGPALDGQEALSIDRQHHPGLDFRARDGPQARPDGGRGGRPAGEVPAGRRECAPHPAPGRGSPEGRGDQEAGTEGGRTRPRHGHPQGGPEGAARRSERGKVACRCFAALRPLAGLRSFPRPDPVSYTHLRAHETDSYLVCRLLLEKKKKKK